MVGIYKIQSPSGKVYIGQSWDIKNRFKYYIKSKCNGQPKLHSSFIKHGVDNHSFEIIHLLPKDIAQNILDLYEVLYIDFYKNVSYDLMNIKDGGRGGKHSEESKKKMSESSKGKQSWLGKKHSDESKNKIRLSKIGKKFTDEQIEKIRQRTKEVNTGNKYSLGFKHSIETRNKKSRPVIQLDLQGNFIKRHNSSTQAAELFGIVYTGIHNVCRGDRKTAAGFKWIYE